MKTFAGVRKISIIRKNLAEYGFKYDMKPRDRWSDYTYFKDGQIDGIHIKMFAVNPLTGGFVGQTETMNDFQKENPRFSSVYFSSRQSLLDEQEWYKKLLNAVYVSNEEAEKGGGARNEIRYYKSLDLRHG